MRKMALLCMFVIVASAAPIYATTPNATNNPVNTTNYTKLVNNTFTYPSVNHSITNTSVNTTNTTKDKEIQNLELK
jgi:hypothetical protein